MRRSRRRCGPSSLRHDAADPRVWALVVERWRAVEVPFELGSALLRLGECAARAGDPDQARDAFDEAIRIGNDLGAAPLVEATEAAARRARVRLSTVREGRRPSSDSRYESSRSSGSSATAPRTAPSPSGCSSRPRPSRSTSPTFWRSSRWATAVRRPRWHAGRDCSSRGQVRRVALRGLVPTTTQVRRRAVDSRRASLDWLGWRGVVARPGAARR